MTSFISTTKENTFLGSIPDLMIQKFWGWGPVLCLTSPGGNCVVCSCLGTTGLQVALLLKAWLVECHRDYGNACEKSRILGHAPELYNQTLYFKILWWFSCTLQFDMPWDPPSAIHLLGFIWFGMGHMPWLCFFNTLLNDNAHALYTLNAISSAGIFQIFPRWL